MTEPFEPDVTDLEALRAALNRVAAENAPDSTNLGDGLWLRDVVRATYRGPRTVVIAETLLASPRARRLLARSWTEECPPSAVIDAAVASPTATPEELTLAHATHILVTTLHANTCTRCRDRLDTLTSEMVHMEDLDVVMRRWTFDATSSPALAGVRGEDHRTTVAPDDVARSEPRFALNDPDLYQRLAAVHMREPQYPSMRLRYDATTQSVTARLVVPGGMAAAVQNVTVLLSTTTGEVRIPIDLAPRDDDDVEFTGTATLPPEVVPTLDTFDIEVG